MAAAAAATAAVAPSSAAGVVPVPPSVSLFRETLPRSDSQMRKSRSSRGRPSALPPHEAARFYDRIQDTLLGSRDVSMQLAPAHAVPDDASTLRRVVQSNRFLIGRPIGKGGFGRVYAGYDTVEQAYVAIKAELVHSAAESQLTIEWETYRHLANCPAVLSAVAFFSPREDAPPPTLRLMAMELGGASLAYLVYTYGTQQNPSRSRRAHTNSENPLTWSRYVAPPVTAWIGIRLVQALQELHSMDILHRDIKPQNIVVPRTRNNELKLLDLGLAKRFRYPTTGRHIEMESGRDFMGTPMYASPAVHDGLRTSRRDDLWSAGITALACGGMQFPWMDVRNYRQPGDDGLDDRRKRKAWLLRQAHLKKSRSPRWGLSKAWTAYFDMVENLEFDEDPPYEDLCTALGLDLHRGVTVESMQLPWDTFVPPTPSVSSV